MSYSSPSLQEILGRFSALRQAPTSDGRRMPHKPLLILLMLGRYLGGDRSDAPFGEIRSPLEQLLRDFGPNSSGKPNTEDPFWRLQNDSGNIWVVQGARGTTISEEAHPPTIRRLLSSGAAGNFPPDLREVFQANPKYVSALASSLLSAHFPPSLHEDICAAVGIELDDSLQPESPETDRNTRDPRFRERIIRAYEHRCAITGWDLRIGHSLAGLEAAHIKWHTVGGPPTENNGLALNSLHHKLFDFGVFTLSLDKLPLVLVSQEAHGGDAVQQMLLRFHGQPIRKPQNHQWLPSKEFINWHQREVFKGEPRN